jgi:hypothetical protein
MIFISFDVQRLLIYFELQRREGGIGVKVTPGVRQG